MALVTTRQKKASKAYPCQTQKYIERKNGQRTENIYPELSIEQNLNAV
jgi:hypothetical protein